MRSDWLWLHDILMAINKIKQYTDQAEEEFYKSELVQVCVIYHLQIIGEAANKLSKNLKKKHPNIPWAEITGLRNIIVHEYFGVDLDEIWSTVEYDLPTLEFGISKILSSETE